MGALNTGSIEQLKQQCTVRLHAGPGMNGPVYGQAAGSSMNGPEYSQAAGSSMNGPVYG